MKNQNNAGALLRLEGVAVAKLDAVSLQAEIDKRVRRVFKLVESESREVHEAAKKALDAYVQGQRELFKAKNLNPDRALKESMVGYEDASGKTWWRIVPRGVTLEEMDAGDVGDHAPSIVASKGYSDRIGIGRDQRRGKYGDAGLLIEQSAASVDASEVVPFAVV